MWQSHLFPPSFLPSPLSLLLLSSPLLLSVAELKAEAARIELETELACQTQSQEAEIQFLREQNELEILKAKELSNIEVSLRVNHHTEPDLPQCAVSGSRTKLSCVGSEGGEGKGHIQTHLRTF